MIHSKSQKINLKIQNQASGFSLIEVIVAILVLGLSVGAIFKFQSQLIRGTFLAHGLIERIPVMKNIFSKADEEKFYEKDEPKKIQDSQTDTSLTYSLKKTPGNSAFAGIDNLYIEKVDAQWPGFLAAREESLIGLRFYVKAGKS